MITGCHLVLHLFLGENRVGFFCEVHRIVLNINEIPYEKDLPDLSHSWTWSTELLESSAIAHPEGKLG